MRRARLRRFLDGEQLELKLCLSAVTFVESDIECCLADRINSVYAADLDGDGDLDVLSSSYNGAKIAWYENTDGAGHFGSQQVITTAAAGATSVHAADFDGDGDLDVLSASSVHGSGKIAWYENTDGAGHFGSQQVITIKGDSPVSVYAADLDGDDDLDVLSASFRGATLPWHENTDGAGHFGQQQVIMTAVGAAASFTSVYAADLDRDGDVDVLSASFYDDRIAWYENTDGLGHFADQQMITTAAAGATSVYAADLNGDGDLDVLSASAGDGKIAWYENTDGAGHFGSQQVMTTAADEAWSVYAADFDGDGDFDVLSASAGDDKIAWYENTDGAGHFGSQQVITTAAVRARSVYAADFDADGDLDVLSASAADGKIAWYENRLIGDSNDNGVFDSGDLVNVFQLGKYEDGIPNNATFDEGDWNQDGDFDSSDLVLTFQAGHYVAAARPLAAEISAAVDWLFARDDDAKKSRAFVS